MPLKHVARPMCQVGYTQTQHESQVLVTQPIICTLQLALFIAFSVIRANNIFSSPSFYFHPIPTPNGGRYSTYRYWSRDMRAQMTNVTANINVHSRSSASSYGISMLVYFSAYWSQPGMEATALLIQVVTQHSSDLRASSSVHVKQFPDNHLSFTTGFVSCSL